MPSSCCVPGCKSNYSVGDSVKVFEFPKTGTSLHEEWIRKIPRQDWVPGKRTVVCILHFKDEDVIKSDSFIDSKGIHVTIPRKRFKLKENAVPSQFPNLPLYLSKPNVTSRTCPTERKERHLERQQEKIDLFLDKDVIKTFDNLKKNINLIDKKEWLLISDENLITYFCIDSSQLPITISKSISIKRDLTLSIYSNGKKVFEDLQWLLTVNADKQYLLNRYSELENLLSWLNNQESKKLVNVFDNLLMEMKNFIDEKNYNGESTNALTFLYEQLSFHKNKNPRYSSQMLSWAFSINITSPICYREIRSSGLLYLPSQRYLRKLTSTLSFSNNSEESEHRTYLATKCSKLCAKNRIVNLLIDEITVRPHISFTSNSLCGMSQNKKLKRATSIQAYMIQSIYSSNKDVVALVPVCYSTAADLLLMTKKVIQLLQECGYTLMSLISDNNRINRNMFVELCGGTLQSHIISPFNGRPIFILFDTVHIIKCIRNNWMNQKTGGSSFFFPSFHNPNTKLTAAFFDLINIYEKEKSTVIKYASKLTFKSLNPNNFEKQNVALCLKIFDDTNVAALKMFNDNKEYDGTIEFLQIIIKWWKVVNIKTPRKGIEHSSCFEEPFSSIADVRLSFFDDMVNWLERWKSLQLPYKGQRSGKLSEETFCSLIHTTKTLKQLIIYQLNDLKDSYVLTGKYQTDPLEGRFGQYRQLHGGNYNISVEQVLKSEKKLRIKSLIELHSSQFGSFKLQKFLDEFKDDENESESITDLEMEIKGIDFCTHTDEELELLPVFLYICGYAAYKMKQKIMCISCRSLFVTNKEVLFELCGETATNYFANIDRGNLTFADDDICRIFVICYKIFTFFLNEEFEEILHSSKIKNVLKHLVASKMEELGICSEGQCADCFTSKFHIGCKFIPTFLNVFLHNYVAAKNDYFASSKGFKRKYETLVCSRSES